VAEAGAGGDKLIDGSLGAAVEIQEADLQLEKCEQPKENQTNGQRSKISAG
jgi:hypothetical protein